MEPKNISETEKKWQPSDELDGVAIGTADEERKRAKAWMDSSAQFLGDAHFWQGEAQRLYRLMKKAHAIGDGLLRTYGINLYMPGASPEFKSQIDKIVMLAASRVDGKMADPDGQEKEFVERDPIRSKVVEAMFCSEHKQARTEAIVRLLQPSASEVAEIEEFLPLWENVEEILFRCLGLRELCEPGHEWNMVRNIKDPVLPVGLIIEEEIAPHYEVVSLSTGRATLIDGPFPGVDFLPSPDRGPPRMRLCPCHHYDNIELVMRSTADHPVPMPEARLIVSRSKRVKPTSPGTAEGRS